MDDREKQAAWTAAQNRFQELSQQGATITFDIRRLEAALYDDIIFDHVNEIVREEGNMGEDGRRYVPRLMMAVIMLLHEKARG